MNDIFVDPEQFKKSLLRSSLIPLFFSLILSAIFSFLILHLVEVLKWVDHTNEVLARNHSTLQIIIDGQSSLRGYVITKQPEFLEQYNKAKEVVASDFEILSQMTEDNPVQSQRIQRIKFLYKNWLEYSENILNANSTDDQIKRVREDGRRLMMEIRSTFEQIIRTEEDLLHQRNAEAKGTINTSIMMIIAGSLISGLFLAFFSRKQLLTATDTYTGALNKSAEQNRTLEKQTWLKELQIGLSKKVLTNENLVSVSKTVIESVCRTVEARVGAFYLVSERALVLQSSYAISEGRDKLPKKLELGKTLVGQAVLEQKPIIMSPAPEGYIEISSTFGHATPASLMIVPIIHGPRAIGVFELGFDRDIRKDDHDVLNALNETIAYLISSAEYRERLQELLEQAQRHAEELQAQQEELRVVNEELEQQSKSLKESHVRLENQQAEMEQTNQQLEEQTQELEHQKNLLNQQNSELEQKSSEIRRSSNYKSEFLANMSHELRTPLNSSLILAKLLIDNKPGTLTKEQVEYAQIIFNSGTDLLNLINDILDLSKVEAGKMTIVPELVMLEGVAKHLEQMFRPIALEKNLDFKIHIDEQVPLDFITDRQRLEQILKNFLSNSFKFTKEGGVSLHIFDNKGKIAFAVADTGIGMSQEEQQVIFEAFRQADGTTNRKFGGTGLGLSISKEFSHLLGGEISVKSEKGHGSTFTLTLPKSYSPSTETAKKSQIVPVIQTTTKTEESILKNSFSFKDDRDSITKFTRRMLIIEDDEEFAKILMGVAHEMKFGALVAETGDEGMALAKTYQPNAIVLDVRLPDHSGMIVLDQLKMNTKTRHIPVHVISSEDFSRSALEMGAIGYMLKPVKKDELLVAFQNMSAAMEQRVKHVLIVEDDEVQRNHIKELISDASVEVTAVETSGEALKQLSEKTFDCMIMDLSLPDMSGHELLAKLSNESSTYSFPPVIVYTARDLTAEEEQKLRLYSGSIIIKGAKSPERLLSEVTLFLHKVETDLPPERQKMLRDLRSREKNLENRTILVVDDDVRNIFALTSALETHGAHVVSARNGKEALEKLNPEIELILMDIMMPEMDGYEAMKRIRLSDKFKDMPIVALTAKAMKDDKEKCIEAGANDYLPKPIEMEKLLSLIRIWLPQKRRFT